MRYVRSIGQILLVSPEGADKCVSNLQTNMSSAAACQSPSPCPSATTSDSSDDEEFGAWIYKNRHSTKRLK